MWAAKMPALTNANDATSVSCTKVGLIEETTFNLKSDARHRHSVRRLFRGYLYARRCRAGPSTSTVAVAPVTSSLRSSWSSAIRTGAR